jgi:putative Ca2+/H+ antiporter (TMEM165/GDT1 family)
MFAAVLLGGLVIRLDSRWTDLVGACAFFLSATLIWFEDQQPLSERPALYGSWSRAAIVSFGSLFFAEWGDPGQISAAALTLKSHAPFAVWMGGTLAMATKGGLAMLLGVKLRDRLPPRKLQALASVSCCVLGALTLARLVFGGS